MNEKPATDSPIVFYDGGCPLCRREIAHYQRIDRDGLIRWLDIQQSEDELQANGLTWEKFTISWL